MGGSKINILPPSAVCFPWKFQLRRPTLTLQIVCCNANQSGPASKHYCRHSIANSPWRRFFSWLQFLFFVAQVANANYTLHQSLLFKEYFVIRHFTFHLTFACASVVAGLWYFMYWIRWPTESARLFNFSPQQGFWSRCNLLPAEHLFVIRGLSSHFFVHHSQQLCNLNTQPFIDLGKSESMREIEYKIYVIRDYVRVV